MSSGARGHHRAPKQHKRARKQHRGGALKRAVGTQVVWLE